VSLVAIFTAPKPFTNPHIATIQRNAILSWKALGAEVEVWLVGEEEGVAEAAAEFGVGYLPNVERNAQGTPRIDSIFNLVRQSSQAPVLAYVNADILLFKNFIQTIETVRALSKRYLLVGQRWDLDVTQPLHFEKGWDDSLMDQAKTEGEFHKPAGSDYFIFPREIFTDIPPFAVGRAGWDNWMIFKGRQMHIPVINSTASIMIVHQNHDYNHLPNGIIHRLQPESLENVKLMGGRYAVYTLYDTSHQLIDGKLKRAPLSRWKVMREISIFPAITLKCPILGKVSYFLFNMKRAISDIKRDRAILAEKK
jgi:hypothetical protein